MKITPSPAPSYGDYPSPPPSPTPEPSYTPPPGSDLGSDVADAFVDETNPDTNCGTNTALRVDGSPLKRSYLRFNVSGIRGTVTKATLRIYADSSGSDLRAYRPATEGGWQENTITWNNAPALGAPVGHASPVTGGTWVDIDVTSLVQADGVHEFAVDTSGGTQIHLSSREDTGHAPQIIVETTG